LLSIRDSAIGEPTPPTPFDRTGNSVGMFQILRIICSGEKYKTKWEQIKRNRSAKRCSGRVTRRLQFLIGPAHAADGARRSCRQDEDTAGGDCIPPTPRP
jgi:hypothetical protein